MALVAFRWLVERVRCPLLMDMVGDNTEHTLALDALDSMFHRDSSTTAQLRFTLLDAPSVGAVTMRLADTLLLNGTHDRDSVYAKLVHRDVIRSPLRRRSLRWIQDYPNNR